MICQQNKLFYKKLFFYITANWMHQIRQITEKSLKHRPMILAIDDYRSKFGHNTVDGHV